MQHARQKDIRAFLSGIKPAVTMVVRNLQTENQTEAALKLFCELSVSQKRAKRPAALLDGDDRILPDREYCQGGVTGGDQRFRSRNDRTLTRLDGTTEKVIERTNIAEIKVIRMDARAANKARNQEL